MKGIVLEIKKGRCVVMKKDKTFVEIRDRNYKIGQEIEIKKFSYSKYAAAACIALFLSTSSFLGYNAYSTPTSYIYMDINPSIRLDLNRFGRVIDIVALNKDAEDMIANHNISKGSADKCMAEIIDVCKEYKYINETNGDVSVSVRTDSNKIENRVLQTVKNLEQDSLKVSVSDIDEKENSEAIKYNISAKRLEAVKKYTKTFGGNIEENTEKLKEMSSKEIYNKIGEYKYNLKSENVNDTESTEDTEKISKTENNSTIFTEESEKNVKGKASGNKQKISSEKKSIEKKSENKAKEKEENRNSTIFTKEDTDNQIENKNTSKTTKSEKVKNRRDAVKEYSETFGGSLEENMEKLKGVSNSEIYAQTESQNAGAAEKSSNTETE